METSNDRAVKAGSAASKSGVRAKDVVKAVNGNPCLAYDNLMAIIGAMGRPVQMEFRRLGADGGDGGGGGGGGGGARSQSEEPGPFQRAQDAARRKMDELKGPPQPPPMTAEAKAERREAALKAAESRTKNWDKRLNKGRQASQAKTASDGVVDNQFEDSQNAETRRMVDLAKRQEAMTAARMGYNPYEARLMGNTAARAAITGGGEAGGGSSLPPPPPLPSNQQTTPSRPPEVVGDEDGILAEAIGQEIDKALRTVLEQGLPMSLTAVQTMLKMMKNMAAKSSDDKFKKIRLGNASFNAKVGGVDGGIEVMMAAGFHLDSDGDEPVLQHGPCDPAPLRLRLAMARLAKSEVHIKKIKGGGESLT
eukprot:jgi/Undpi1/13653/HiC_scaffold_9.g03307.m1